MVRRPFLRASKSWPFSSGWFHLIVRLRPSHHRVCFQFIPRAHCLLLPTSQKLQSLQFTSAQGFLSLNTADILGQIIPHCVGVEAVSWVGCLTESTAPSKNGFQEHDQSLVMTIPNMAQDSCEAKSSSVGNYRCSLFMSIHPAKPLSCFPSHIFTGKL